MLVLTLDTSTPTVTVGVVERSGNQFGVLADESQVVGRGHAEVLSPMIITALTRAAITRADLDAVVVGCGPGPFTGLRVGMATAAGFADALGIPAHGVCSLDAIAAVEPAPSMLVVTDARRREIYWAHYENGRRVDGPAVGSPVAVVDRFAAIHLDHVSGSPSHAELFGRPTGVFAAPTVAGLYRAAKALLDEKPVPLSPWYLRRPDALTLAERAAAKAVR